MLATRNEHKRREFARLLGARAGGLRLRLLVLPASVALPPEHAPTFAENALPKARAAATGTGQMSIADDSGIEAAALGGAPGIHSARFAGEQEQQRGDERGQHGRQPGDAGHTHGGILADGTGGACVSVAS